MANLAEALSIAFDHYAAGRFDAAAEIARRILAVAPDQPAAAQLAGAALAALGYLADSAAAFRHFLTLRPADATGWSNLANLLANAGETAAALAGYHQALRCEPAMADARANRAALLTRIGRKQDAAAAARLAIACDPGHSGALINLADALMDCGGRPAAMNWAERATRRAPHQATAWLTLAAALAASGDLPAGRVAAEQARTRNPRLLSAAESLGLICARLDDFPAAEAALADAAALGGGESLIRTRATARIAMAQPLAALADIDQALALAPEDAGMHWNRAAVLLQAGRWAEGWAEFEWRRHDRNAQPPWRKLAVAPWDGAPLNGRRILLYAEQGLGDALQMLRFVPVVAAMGGAVILEVQPPLVNLARRISGVAQVLARGDALPAVDLECPLMSLPGVLGVTPVSIPGAVPFLTADPARVEHWRRRLDAAADPCAGLRIGLVWAGNPQFPDDRRRSPRLAPLLPLINAFPAVQFFALQMGDGRRDLDGVRQPDNFTDLGCDITDLDDSAAIMAGLDLVISSCTMPAHLAIALNRPLWLMLPFTPDWRWLLDRDDTPWHPGARLFRQSTPGDWAGVVARMADALAKSENVGTL